jgi:hypothetical protein
MTDTYSEPLAGLDSWFLYGERHEAPLHIGATYIFEGTPRKGPGWPGGGPGATIEERASPRAALSPEGDVVPGSLGNPVRRRPRLRPLVPRAQGGAPSPGDDATARLHGASSPARSISTSRCGR